MELLSYRVVVFITCVTEVSKRAAKLSPFVFHTFSQNPATPCRRNFETGVTHVAPPERLDTLHDPLRQSDPSNPQAVAVRRGLNGRFVQNPDRRGSIPS